jgi:hypothetical protein
VTEPSTPSTPPSGTPAGADPVADRSGGAFPAFLTDVLLVLLFAVIGRASHGEDLSPGGVATTTWPFLVGLVAGWSITLGWRAPVAPVRTGLGVWAVTLVGGMLLRALSGQGVVVAFVIVAAIVLLVFLVGWRALFSLIRRTRRRSASR